MNNKRKITLGAIIVLILLFLYSCSTRFGFFGKKEIQQNKNIGVVSDKEKGNREKKKEEIKNKEVSNDKKENKNDDNSTKKDKVKGKYEEKAYSNYFKKNTYISTYCPIKNAIDKKIEVEKIKEIENKNNISVEKENTNENIVENNTNGNGNNNIIDEKKDLDKIEDKDNIVDNDKEIEEISKVPSDAPIVDLPVAEIEKVASDAPVVELEVYDDTYEKKLSVYEDEILKIKVGDYSTLSYENFRNILEQAKDYKYSIVVSAEEKNRILLEVENAYNELSVDKTALNEEIEKAKAVDENSYSEDSYSSFKKVLDEVELLKEKAEVKQSELDEATNKLKEAFTKLGVNKESLIEKLTEAENKVSTDYSTASYEKLSEKIEKAKAVKDKENATQAEINEAERALQEAITGLTVDKTALNTEIELAEEIVKNRELYTEDSYNEFFLTFENAKTVNELSTAKQNEVDTETEELKEAIKSLVKKEKVKSELTITKIEKDLKTQTATIKYNLVDEDNTFVSAKAKLYKGDDFVKEVDVNNTEAVFTELELDVEYRVETELTYNFEGTEKSEILEDKRSFNLESDVKKVELKNIENISVLKKDEDKFVAISSLTNIPNDLENYFVRFKSTTMTDSILKVDRIEENGDTFKVVATAPALSQYNSVNKNYDNDYTVLVNKKSTERGVYTSFKELVEAIKSNPSGNFVLGADVSADEIELSGDDSYITEKFTGTLTAKRNGKVYSILGLKAPLFNDLGNSTIDGINLIDVNIRSTSQKVGALAKTANDENSNSVTVNISNVNVQGNIFAPANIGGLVANANKTNIRNVTFTGNISMSTSAGNSFVGGIVGSIDRGSLLNASVIADMNVITNSPNNKAGMIAGRVPNINITNVYIKGNLVSSRDVGQVGGFVGSMWRDGYITNALSEVDVINGVKIHGDKGGTNARNSIRNNVYVLENKSGTDDVKNGNNLVQNIDKNRMNELIGEYSIPKFEKENKFANSFIDYSELDEYAPDKKNAYENMEKIIPLYNRDYILKQGNKVESSSNLYSKKVISVVPMVDNKVVTNISSNKESINKLMVYYSDNTVEYLPLIYKEDFENAISEYLIDGTELIYTPNQYITDYSRLIESVKDEFKNVSYTSDEVYNILNYIPPSDPKKAYTRDVVLEKLYLKYSFENVKENIESLLTSLISNSNIFGSADGTNNEYIKKYLSENKANILLGLSYLQRWYNIDFGNINIKDIVMFRQDFFGKNINELEWVANVGKLGFNSLNPVNNFTTYPTLLSNNTGESNLFSYLEKNKSIFEPNKTMNQWFKESTKAYIVEKPSLEATELNTTFYETLKKEFKSGGNLIVDYRRMVLPLLTMSDEGLYIIKTIGTVSFGSMERYVTGDFNSLSETDKKERLNEIKKRVDIIAESHKDYYDFWYRLTPANTKNKLKRDIPNWDTLFNNNFSKWYSEYGADTVISVNEFFAPTGTFSNHSAPKFANWEAYAGGSSSIFIKVGILDMVNGPAVYAHEMTHNSDGGIYFGGFGRRDNFGMEAYARGMFEPPRGANSFNFGLNLIYDFRTEKGNTIHNTHPSRFGSDEELQQYMSRVMDMVYTLDYFEAMSLIKKPYVDQTEVLRQIKYKEDGSNSAFKDFSNGVTAEFLESLNMQTINDFVDNNIAVRGYYAEGDHNRNTYNVANLFNPFYGIIENHNGASGGHTFKRTAFELLAVKGYENGMLPYITNKFKNQAIADGVAFSDSYILNKIFNGQYSSFAEFKKDQFKQRIDLISRLKPVTITFKNQEHTLDSFEKVMKLMDAVTTQDIDLRKRGRYQHANNVTDLKSTIYKAYFKLTDEFRTSIYND